MRVELRKEARSDLVDGAKFYEEQRVGLGDYFLDELFGDLSRLANEGGIHAKQHGCHRKLSKTFPFAIYYLVDGTTIDVVAILDCRSDPKSISRHIESRID